MDMDQDIEMEAYDNPAMIYDENEVNVRLESGTSFGAEHVWPVVIRRKNGDNQAASPSGPGGLEELPGIAVTPEHNQVNLSVNQTLDDFINKRQGKNAEQHNSNKVRSYYKRQDALIDCFEEASQLQVLGTSTDTIGDRRKLATFYSKVTLVVNLVLLVAKVAASVLSGSMSIISSLVDSAVDLLSGVILWWASRAMKRRDPIEYPQGRTKLEPLSIVILSVVMGLASLQLIRESGEEIVTLVKGHMNLPHMGLATFLIAGSTVVVKLILWLTCRRVNSPTVQTLALDHRNDVMSNTVAIVCGYLGSQNFQNSTQLSGFAFADPLGAILISFYIIYNWWQTGSEQIKTLTGYTAGPDFLSKLTWIAMNHDPHISHIDTLRAYHYGNRFIVKVHIVLPESMILRKAHDIGESLQQKLEGLEEVERAFVHVDYNFSHKPSSEHKII